MKSMKKTIVAVFTAGALLLAPGVALAQEADPNDVPAVDNPLDENDNDAGFDDWGLLGLLGLLGLAGLARRDRRTDARGPAYRDTVSRT